MRDRCPVGVNTFGLGQEFGSWASNPTVTDAQGWHSHGGAVTPTALSVDELAPHSHSGWTDQQGAHSHTVALYAGPPDWANPNNPSSYSAGTGTGWAHTDTQGNHGHNIGTNSTGSGNPHQHGVYGDGNHQHNVSSVSIVQPGTALYFIMKIT
jgi:hypothetical protein